ncbi:MAG: hypothetical protein COA84_03575 [Robiginitomaculum sp.]|nr:MAG: hypothetical protein COA84_03575 [Robiginitomaculum sp.]
MPKGRGQIISTFTWQGAARGFDRQGNARVDLLFQKYENALFIEYGLTDRWTVIARPALQNVHLRFENTVDAANGLGATELSIRRVLAQKGPWVMSIQAGGFVPGSVENGFDKPLGQKGLDWEVRTLAGRSLQVMGRPGFLDVQAAFRERSLGSSNEIRLDSTFGVDLSRRIQLLGQANIVIGLPSSQPAIRTVDSIKAQAGLVWFYRPRRGLQVSLSRTFMGRNVVRDTGVTIGFWQKF